MNIENTEDSLQTDGAPVKNKANELYVYVL